jgi:hypothetical protein
MNAVEEELMGLPGDLTAIMNEMECLEDETRTVLGQTTARSPRVFWLS